MSQLTTTRAIRTIGTQMNWLFLLCLSLCGLVGLFLLQNPGHLAFWDVFGLIGLGLIGIWRWSWFLVRMVRARIFLHWVFPKWRRIADTFSAEELPHVCLLVPTYREEYWITERVFRSVAQAAKTLSQPITLLVNSSSDDENALIQSILDAEDPGLEHMRVIWMTQKDGKRKAMADGLRELARVGLPANSVVALMDGDSELDPNTLRRCLPLFQMFPNMGALTTDEIPVVQGSYFFSEWFHLRFAQRHLQMCSDALARKVMCLTGRFSLFRAETALAPSFAQQLEHDAINDWLWGRFQFLSGDDKSTWYWILRHRYDMLYVPDAVVYSIETVSGSVIDRAYNNMRRWYGNMLRNSNRALALGPQTTGWFIWYCLLDQRISFWTCLITPGFLLVSLLQGHWIAAGIVVSWICFSRPLMLGLVFWYRSSPVKPIHVPLLLMSQWCSSLVKIWTQMNLVQQQWSNRGNQSISADGKGLKRMTKVGTARFLLVSQLFAFGIFLGWLSGALDPGWDLQGLRLTYQSSSPPVQYVEAIEFGIQPSDGQDDTVALQRLLTGLPTETKVVVNLPIGELDFTSPLEINRSNLTLRGQGAGRTILQAHFGPETAEAVVNVRPAGSSEPGHELSSPQSASPQLYDVHLRGFTLRQGSRSPASNPQPGPHGILLENLENSSLSFLALETDNPNPLVLNHTQDIKIEYVSAEGSRGFGGQVSLQGLSSPPDIQPESYSAL